MKARDHYHHHLGNFYSWMVGDFEEKQHEQESYFKEREIRPFSSKIAFDLGSGHGLQSVALAKIGFIVKAIDFNQQLLDELQRNKGNLNIEGLYGDMLHFLKETPQKAELIVCMGDTLTHLENLEEVSELISEISSRLEPKGRIIFSFRDFTVALKEEERFIFVKGDDSRVLTCFLEYFFDHVMVHDLLYEKHDGNWIQKISAYPKLRLAQSVVINLLREHSIEITRSEVIRGMTYLFGSLTG